MNIEPLLKVVGRWVKEIKKGEIRQYPEYIYLLPELVSLTGMDDEQRKNHRNMKLVAGFTKMNPDERVKLYGKAIKMINNPNSKYDNPDKLISIKNPKKMSGVILDRP